MKQVIVKTDKFKNLTKGKSYVIDSVSEDPNYYWIVNNAGVTSRYHISNFQASSKSEGGMGAEVKEVSEIDKFIDLLNRQEYHIIVKYFVVSYQKQPVVSYQRESDDRITISLNIKGFRLKSKQEIVLYYYNNPISCGIRDIYGLDNILGYVMNFSTEAKLDNKQSNNLLSAIFRVIIESISRDKPCAFINLSTSLDEDSIYLDTLNYLAEETGGGHTSGIENPNSGNIIYQWTYGINRELFR